jgi:chemotaxis response regulator CheB
MEELAAKREAHRQAARAHREKAKENQQPRDNHASIENIEQSGNDIDPETSAAERRAYYVGADEAGYTAPAFIRNAPDPAAEAFQIIRHMSCQQWQRLIYLMDKHELLPVKGSEEGDSIIEAGRRQVEAAPPDDGLDIPDHLRRGAS